MDEKAQRFSEECGPYAGMVYRHCLHMLSRPEEWSETLAKTNRLVMTLSQLKSLTRSERDTLIELQSGGFQQ